LASPGQGSPGVPPDPPTQPAAEAGHSPAPTGNQPPEKQGSPPPDPRRKRRRRIALYTVGGIILAVAAVYGVRYYIHSLYWVTTDDAFIAGHVTPISPRVSGYVLHVLIDDNQLVHRDELMIELDPRDFQAVVEQDQAAVAAAQARVEQSKADLKSAQADAAYAQAEVVAAQAQVYQTGTNLKRLQSLSPDAVTNQELVDAQAAATAASAQLDAAQKRHVAARDAERASAAQVQTSEADVNQARAQLAQAQLNLSYTQIRAPDVGWVTNKSVEPGQYFAAGMPMFALVDPNIWVVANFKETELKHMRPGQPAVIRIDALGGRKFAAHVDSIQAGSGAAFSLLPPENATGNYVKVVQRVPVKLVFNQPFDPRLPIGPGESVVPEVKVR
jgi:membrane fusion protein (multidrug efflux system)